MISCLLSKGMAEDKTKRALKARVVDSCMASDEEALVMEYTNWRVSGNECGQSTRDCIASMVFSTGFLVFSVEVSLGKEIEVF